MHVNNGPTKLLSLPTMPCECGEWSYDQNNEISNASIVCFKSSLVWMTIFKIGWGVYKRKAGNFHTLR